MKCWNNGLRDISNEPYVKYGSRQRTHKKMVFALDHPEYKLNTLVITAASNDKHPFAHAS